MASEIIKNQYSELIGEINTVDLFVCFVALRPQSTAVVIAGQSVHLTTLFLGRLEQAVNQ